MKNKKVTSVKIGSSHGLGVDDITKLRIEFEEKYISRREIKFLSCFYSAVTIGAIVAFTLGLLQLYTHIQKFASSEASITESYKYKKHTNNLENKNP